MTDTTTKVASREEVLALLNAQLKDNKYVFWGEWHGHSVILPLLSGGGIDLKGDKVTTAFVETDPFSAAASIGMTSITDNCRIGYNKANHLSEDTTMGFDPHIMLAAMAGLRVIGHDDVTDITRLDLSNNLKLVNTGEALDRRDTFATKVIKTTDDGNHAIILGGASHGKNNPDEQRPSQQALGDRLNAPSVYFSLKMDPEKSTTRRIFDAFAIKASDWYANKACTFTIDESGKDATYKITTNNPMCLNVSGGSKDAAANLQAAAAKAKEMGACGHHAELDNGKKVLSFDEVATFISQYKPKSDAAIGQ